jgi:hypothetical protein
MPADIVQTTLLPARMQECVVLMDDYGSVHRLYISVAQAATRQALITAQQTAMNERQTQLESYAAANNHDLSSQKLPNLAAKQAKLKAPSK